MVVDESGRLRAARCPVAAAPGVERRAGPPGAASSSGQPPWRRPADRHRAAASGGEPRARDRRRRARHGRNADLGLDPHAGLRAVHRSRSHDPRASRRRGPERRSDGEPIRGEGTSTPRLCAAPRGPAGRDRPSPGPGDRHQRVDLGRAGRACRDRLRPPGPARGLALLAVAVAYLPAVLLLTAALEPSELVERLIAGIGPPALALVTLRLTRAYGALAIAGAVTVLGYAIDVIAGSSLTELSLIGPEPGGRRPLLRDRQRARGDVRGAGADRHRRRPGRLGAPSLAAAAPPWPSPSRGLIAVGRLRPRAVRRRRRGRDRAPGRRGGRRRPFALEDRASPTALGVAVPIVAVAALARRPAAAAATRT